MQRNMRLQTNFIGDSRVTALDSGAQPTPESPRARQGHSSYNNSRQPLTEPLEEVPLVVDDDDDSTNEANRTKLE